jgi:Peptidase family M23/N-acetylmuramoyl-L-alanine amidase
MAHPTELHFITCDFGTPGGWQAGYHTGRDYRAQSPTPVFATRAGKVLHAGFGGWGPAYGMQVIVQTGPVKHMYAHLSSVNCRAGQQVAEGEQVALSGRTSSVSIPFHLHYEERISPYGYMDHRKPELDRTEVAGRAFTGPSKKRRVDVGKVDTAFHADPGRAQGDGIHPLHVRPVEMALLSLGFLDSVWAMDGYAGTRTREAYRAFQRSLGFTGADANGIPGKTSLSQLGRQFGFTVVGETPAPAPAATRTRGRSTSAPAPVWCPMATRDQVEGQTEAAPWNSGTPHWKGVLHTTEGSSYAGARAAYTDGGVPHFTVAPDFQRNRGEIFQHFPLSSRATALRDENESLKENRAHAIQIEIVGTCDERNRGSFAQGLFIKDWPGWYVAAIGRLMRWLEEHRGIDHASTVEWKSFAKGGSAGSFGASNGVRMSNAEFVGYSGWLGHQHVPDNVHGDPGDIDIAALLAVKPKMAAAPKDATVPLPVG